MNSVFGTLVSRLLKSDRMDRLAQDVCESVNVYLTLSSASKTEPLTPKDVLDVFKLAKRDLDEIKGTLTNIRLYTSQTLNACHVFAKRDANGRDLTTNFNINEPRHTTAMVFLMLHTMMTCSANELFDQITTYRMVMYIHIFMLRKHEIRNMSLRWAQLGAITFYNTLTRSEKISHPVMMKVPDTRNKTEVSQQMLHGKIDRAEIGFDDDDIIAYDTFCRRQLIAGKIEFGNVLTGAARAMQRITMGEHVLIVPSYVIEVRLTTRDRIEVISLASIFGADHPTDDPAANLSMRSFQGSLTTGEGWTSVEKKRKPKRALAQAQE